MGKRNDILIRIPEQSRNALQGKLLVVVLSAMVLGAHMASWERKRHDQFVHGSESEVAALLDEYEAKCREEPDSAAYNTLAILLFLGFLCAVYELGGRI